jgi:hypothetical protein
MANIAKLSFANIIYICAIEIQTQPPSVVTHSILNYSVKDRIGLAEQTKQS